MSELLSVRSALGGRDTYGPAELPRYSVRRVGKQHTFMNGIHRWLCDLRNFNARNIVHGERDVLTPDCSLYEVLRNVLSE